MAIARSNLDDRSFSTNSVSVSMSRRRRFVFRLLAVFVGLGVVLLFEVVLRLGGWGRIGDIGDPFVEFNDAVPLFELTPDGNRYQIPVSRQVYFQPDGFAADKPADEFRIFCLGGSTVQGRPFSIETSFTTWLELSLQAADPMRPWEVVNCGGVSYASYRLVPIMKEVLAHEPDLFVIYTGHNEFLEDRTYARIKNAPSWLKAIHELVVPLRIYGVIRRLWLEISNGNAEQPTDGTKLSTEVDTLLDYEGGLEAYHADDEWRRGVVDHFEVNLRRMTRIARSARVPVMLVNPVSNLKDTPPFKCEHRTDLSAAQLADFGRIWDEAKTIEWSQIGRKVGLLKQALEIDDRYADAHFLLAKCYDEMGNELEAKAEYIRAKDEDICPLRIIEPLHEVILTVASQSATPVVDVRQIFESDAQDGIPGDLLLVDHVHPSIAGHQRIALSLLDEMIRQRFVSRRRGWEENRKALFIQQFQTLSPSYFPRGAERLRGLRRWTQGRVSRVGTSDSTTGQ